MSALIDYTVPTLYPGGQARLLYTEGDEIGIQLPKDREPSFTDAEDMLGIMDDTTGDEIVLHGQCFDAQFIRQFSTHVHKIREGDNVQVLCTFNQSRYRSNNPPYALTLIYQHPRPTLIILTGIGKNTRRSEQNISTVRERAMRSKTGLVTFDGFPLPVAKANQFLDSIS